MLEVAALVFFPALMAYAAASDLLTMTISNRVSIALVVGFAGVALACGMPAKTPRRGTSGLRGRRSGPDLHALRLRLDRRRRCEARRRYRRMARLDAPFRLWIANLAARRGFDGWNCHVAQVRAPGDARGPPLDHAAACGRQWRALRDRSRGRGSGHLPRHGRLDGSFGRLKRTAASKRDDPFACIDEN